MDVVSEFTSKVPLMILQGFFKGFMMVWWVFLIPIGYIAIRLLLALKFDVRTFAEFLAFLKKLLFKEKELDKKLIPTIRKHNFPKDFIWMDNFTYFKFGAYGLIRFDKKNSKTKNVFRMLTEAKGEYVDTQYMAEQINDSPENTRAIIGNLKEKIRGNPKLNRFVSIETEHQGAYRLAIKISLLDK